MQTKLPILIALVGLFMLSLLVVDTAFAFYLDFGFRRQVRQNVLEAACGPASARQVDNVLGWNPNGERRTFQIVGTTADPLIQPGTCPQRQTWGPATGSCSNLSCVTPNSVIAISLRGSIAPGQQHTACAVDDISPQGPTDHRFSVHCIIAPRFGQVLNFAVLNPG
ncbi:MAG: hypothetical protein WBL68_00775 [Nitrososphaeraceae archaeon]